MLEFLGMFIPFLEPVAYTITAATAITALTPTKADDKIINIVLTILNLFAGNVLKNKNKDA